MRSKVCLLSRLTFTECGTPVFDVRHSALESLITMWEHGESWPVSGGDMTILSNVIKPDCNTNVTNVECVIDQPTMRSDLSVDSSDCVAELRTQKMFLPTVVT